MGFLDLTGQPTRDPHSDPLETDELHAMEYVRACHPNRWRLTIRGWWESGNYPSGLSERLRAALQGLRNNRGPAWLSGFKFPKDGR